MSTIQTFWMFIDMEKKLTFYNVFSRYCLTSCQINTLRELGYTWNSIANAMCVSVRILYNHRAHFGMLTNEAFSDISDVELDSVITQFHIIVIDKRLIGILNCFILFLKCIYCLNRYIDGNHKLAQWGFFFHGCVDGFSRCIIYLKCYANNMACMVLSLFQEGVCHFGLPSRVCGDAGLENIDVRGSFIVERSVHNQRIEWLWAELNRVLSFYYKHLFLSLEKNNLLDVMSAADLFALKYIYLPRINAGVNEFIQQWNNHSLSTEHNMSPLQLWTSGVLQHSLLQGNLLDECSNSATCNQNEHTTVSLSATVLPQNEDAFLQTIDPFTDDGNHSIEHYLLLRTHLHRPV
uniref:Integrase core domain-containing protein n=1 Tax=Erpetoichthys calabaricus TaxID=27687 RepID=A0A8C4T7K9_ERPCA